MRIANITEEGRGGGPLFGMLTSAVDLREIGVEATIIFPRWQSEGFRQKLEDADIKYHQLGLSHLTRYFPHLLKYIVFFIPEIISLVRHLSKEKYDLLLCNGSWQVKGVIAAKIAKVPCTWHMNDSQMPKQIHYLFKYVSRLPDAFMFASEKSKTYYSEINNNILDRVNQVIQSPIDIDKFKNSESNQTELSKLDGLKVITISYLNANKNVELIIKAVNKLKQNSSIPIHVFIVGPVLESQKVYKTQLDQYIEKHSIPNIHFLGYRSDIPQLLSDSDVYCCSSNFESSPISVWEAMVNGTMVISTDVGDVRQIIEANNAGIVIETNSVDQLATALNHAADERTNEMYANQGKSIASSVFDSKKIAEEIKAFFNKVVSS